MKRKRRITECYYNLFLKKFEAMLKQIVYRECGNDADEYFPIAQQELLYALIHFDQFRYVQIKKGSLSTYIFRRVQGRLRHAILKAFRCNRTELREPAYLENCVDSSVIDIDLPIFVQELLDCLTNKEANIVRGFFLDNKTLRELAMETQLSTAGVAAKKNQAIEKMRRLVTA